MIVYYIYYFLFFLARSVYRENTYNHGLVVANRQILRGQSYQVCRIFYVY